MITVKEEFVGCDKWKRAVELAGSDSIVLWLALKRYAAANLTDGFIPDEEIERLNGAPKKPRRALDALLNCGALKPSGNRDVGLVEQKGKLGWQLHDYEDHANSSTEEELRKEKARERKRRQREDKARELAALKAGQQRDMSQGQSGTDVPQPKRDITAGHVPGTERDLSQGPHAQTGARPPASAPQRDPSPTHPNPAQEQETAAPSAGAFPMYLLWEPTAQTIAGLEIAGVAAWAVPELVGRFKAHFLADPSETSSSPEWNQRCAKWVIGDWRIPAKRPQKPDPSTTGDLGEYGKSEDWAS